VKTGAILGLAAMLQALVQVRRLSFEASWDEAQALPLIESLFHTDADSAESVYGTARSLHAGIEILCNQMEGRQVDPQVARMAGTILHLERKLTRRQPMLKLLSGHIHDAERARDAFGTLHDNVIERMSEAYSDTLSRLSPRVMVQGNSDHLSNPRNVARIRALLLTAIRGAVLWRQSGGSGWHLLIKRRKILAAARALLQNNAGAA
jgi:high frequency lysogenization protein